MKRETSSCYVVLINQMATPNEPKVLELRQLLTHPNPNDHKSYEYLISTKGQLHWESASNIDPSVLQAAIELFLPSISLPSINDSSSTANKRKRDPPKVFSPSESTSTSKNPSTRQKLQNPCLNQDRNFIPKIGAIVSTQFPGFGEAWFRGVILSVRTGSDGFPNEVQIQYEDNTFFDMSVLKCRFDGFKGIDRIPDAPQLGGIKNKNKGNSDSGNQSDDSDIQVVKVVQPTMTSIFPISKTKSKSKSKSVIYKPPAPQSTTSKASMNKTKKPNKPDSGDNQFVFSDDIDEPLPGEDGDDAAITFLKSVRITGLKSGGLHYAKAEKSFLIDLYKISKAKTYYEEEVSDHAPEKGGDFETVNFVSLAQQEQELANQRRKKEKEEEEKEDEKRRSVSEAGLCSTATASNTIFYYKSIGNWVVLDHNNLPGGWSIGEGDMYCHECGIKARKLSECEALINFSRLLQENIQSVPCYHSKPQYKSILLKVMSWEGGREGER